VRRRSIESMREFGHVCLSCLGSAVPAPCREAEGALEYTSDLDRIGVKGSRHTHPSLTIALTRSSACVSPRMKGCLWKDRSRRALDAVLACRGREGVVFATPSFAFSSSTSIPQALSHDIPHTYPLNTIIPYYSRHGHPDNTLACILNTPTSRLFQKRPDLPSIFIADLIGQLSHPPTIL
jgi:hypothetical protein